MVTDMTMTFIIQQWQTCRPLEAFKWSEFDRCNITGDHYIIPHLHHPSLSSTIPSTPGLEPESPLPLSSTLLVDQEALLLLLSKDKAMV